jgi:hypothetical protein
VPGKPTFANPSEIDIPAGPVIWTMAEDFVFGPVKVKIELIDPEALWQYATDQYCKAGGTLRNDLNSILPTAPIGALIGKLGGGTADIPPPAPSGMPPGPLAAGIRLFAAGAFAVIDVKDIDSGPLFLGMNDVLGGFANHGGKLKVRVSFA